MRFFNVVWFSLLLLNATVGAETPVLQPISVQLQWKHQFEFAGFYAAIAQGFYAQHGLQVELHEYQDGMDVVAEVLAGRAQYGVFHGGIVRARLQGQSVKLLANYFKRLPLVILAKPGIGNLADLSGKRLMASTKDLESPLFKLAFEREGLKVGENLEIVPHTFNAEPFLQNQVDAMTAFISNEPFYLEQQDVRFNIIDLYDYMRTLGDVYLFTSETQAQQAPEQVQAFIKATNEGWRYALEHKVEIVDLILAKYSQRKSREALLYEADKVQDMVLPLPLPIGSLYSEMIQDVAHLIMQQEKLEDKGYLKDFFFPQTQVVAALVFTPAEQSYLAQNTFRMAQTDEWMPILFKDSNGALTGFSLDYWQLLANKLGLHTRVVGEMPYHLMLEAMQADFLDIVINTAKTVERENDALFSDAYEQFPIAIAARKETPFISSTTLLSGQKVAVGRNYSTYHLLKACCKDIDFVQVENTHQALELLAAGKVFAAVDILPVLQYQLGNFPSNNIKLAGVTNTFVELRVMVQRQHAQLVPLLNRAIAAISEEERQTIAKKWMYGSVVTQVDYRLLWQISAGLFLIIAIVLYWNRQLTRSQKALRRSEHFIRSTIDALSEQLCVLDATGKVLMVNRAWREFAEANPPTLDNYGIGANYLEVCARASGDDVAQAGLFANGLRAVLRGDQADFSLEYHFQIATNAYWFIARISRFPNADKTLCLLVTHENITSRKFAENAMLSAKQQAEAALHERNLILNNALVGIVLLKERRFIWLNDHAAAMLGYTQAEVLGRSTEFMYADPSDYQKFGDQAPAVLARGEAYQGEYLLRCKEGSELWCLLSGRAIDPQDLAQGTLYIVVNIDSRKQAEARLCESEEKLRSLYELSPLGLALTDMQGRFVEFNDAFGKICGNYTTEELKALNYWALTSPEYAEQEIEPLKALEQKGRYGPYEKNYRCKDGSLIPLRFNGVLVNGRDGQAYIWSLVEDVSAQKRHETELRQAKEQAEAANRAKSAFLANMTHELRTPLNAVLGYAQILLDDKTLTPEQRQSIAYMQRSGDYLLTLINDVLDLAKIETGRLELMPAPCELNDFFAEITELFRLQAQSKGIAFTYRATQLPYSVAIDAKRMRQICMNLLSNAVKFTEHGEIRLTVEYLEEFLIVQVLDTGCGIPIALQEDIFTPFRHLTANQYKQHKQRDINLGLAFCRRLIEQMQGSLKLRSEVGQGSCFSVRLPAPPVHKVRLVQAAEKPPATVVGYQRTDQLTAALHILIVDDDPFNREIVMRLLKNLGFLFSQANDGKEAVTLAAQQHFDIILMDIHMPNVNGLEATQQIHAHSTHQAPPIVALTASVLAEDRTACSVAGCRDYLDKPINKEKLLQLLQKHLPLQWLYAEPTRATQPPNAAAMTAPRVTLAATWFTDLEQALVNGDHTPACQLINQVQTLDAKLWTTLNNWLESYDYLQLLAWIEKHRDTNRDTI